MIDEENKTVDNITNTDINIDEIDETDYDKVDGKRYLNKELKESIFDTLSFTDSKAMGFVRAAFYLVGELEKSQKGLNSVFSFRNPVLAFKFCQVVGTLTGYPGEMAFVNPTDKRKVRRFVVELPEKVTLELLSKLKVITTDKRTGKLATINNSLPKFEDEEYTNGFFILLYLEAGKLSSYDDYKLEIQLDTLEQVEEISEFLESRGISSGHNDDSLKLILRTNAISDFFALSGETKVAINLGLYFINKSMNGNITRKENFMIANLDKTLTASAQQIVAIMTIRNANKFGRLSDELQELAKAREENPDLSIQKIAELLQISKSTAYHRMERIIEYAKEVK